MDKPTSWEKAFSQMDEAQAPTDELKQRQREIQQQGWQQELPNLGDERDELQKISDLLGEFKQPNEPVHKSVERLIEVHKRTQAQMNRVQQAMNIL